jgi:hypothetical protein
VECAADADFCDVMQLLTIPELLHSVRMQEWIKRNSYIKKKTHVIKKNKAK